MDRSGIFAGDDPFALAPGLAGRGRAAANRTTRTPSRWPRSMPPGMPNVRMVLLKEHRGRRLRLLHQLRPAAKGQEIAASGQGRLRAALEVAAPPDPRPRPVTEREEGPQADAYYRQPQPEEPPRRLGLGASRSPCPRARR